MTEIIDVVTIDDSIPGTWEPEVGQEFLGLLNYLTIPEESKTHLTDETRRILGKCVPPTEETGGRTGLVIGYVQSGKTLSFTAVSALARDNNYPILIVMAGISIPLSGQSVDRLRKDLRIDGNERTDRSWAQFTNPKGKVHEDAIRRAVANWKDPAVPKADRQTILITVMKNHTHLKNLIEVLSVLDLAGVPALIVDDEADQASLNTKAQKEGEESTTYAKIMELCRRIPHHTFLQYTATPQAPLLINLIDKLSPTFTEVLTPGPGYVGGKQFFQEHPELVYTIPEVEATNADTQDPPESLIYSLQIFFLGVASAWSFGENRDPLKNRSMLIHPSHRTDPHSQFFQWVTETRKRWEKTLESDDEDRKELLAEFQAAYDDLAKTVKDLPSFDRLTDCLLLALRNTTVMKVNSRNSDGRTPTIEWKKNYSYVLIGGQAMDRGFTVEGLTVTYMSRGIGVGNADTLQQRARFFGYKEKYMGYCRISLDQKMRRAFKEYVDLEEDIRRQLKEYSNNGKPLSEWKRAFLIADFLNPTRRNVLKDPYTKGKLSNSWYSSKVPYGSKESDEKNRQVVDEFVRGIELSADEAHPTWSSDQKHSFNNNLPLQKVYEELLTRFLVTSGNDANNYIGLLLQIKNYLDEHPDETCSLYVMRKASPDAEWLLRERSLDETGRVSLFQGRDPSGRTDSYPGDEKIGDRDNVIIQLYRLRIFDSKAKSTQVGDDIRTVAVWIPKKMAKSWLVQ